MRNLTMTTLSISVHPKDESPVFGEQSMIVSIEDEGAGPYISILQVQEGVKISMDIEQLEAVVVAARQLLSAKTIELGIDHDG